MPPKQALRILLVEDDEVDIENVRRAFADSTATTPISIARDGEQALAALNSGEVPLERLLILLDLNMPRMNGIEFLQALRDDPRLRQLPVVVLTTSDAERDRIRAYDLHVAGYILKPVTFEAFVAILDAVETYWRLQEFP